MPLNAELCELLRSAANHSQASRVCLRIHGVSERLMRGIAASLIVVAATLYVAALCAIHTNVISISNDVMAVVDGAITLAALGLALTSAASAAWLVLFLL